MVPWQQEDRNSTRTQLGSLDMKSKQLTMNETDGPKRQLSSAKYNLIKERLAAGWAGSGPAASRPSVGGQTRCSNSGDQFQRMPVLEQLVMLSKTRGGGNTAKVQTMMC